MVDPTCQFHSGFHSQFHSGFHSQSHSELPRKIPLNLIVEASFGSYGYVRVRSRASRNLCRTATCTASPILHNEGAFDWQKTDRSIDDHDKHRPSSLFLLHKTGRSIARVLRYYYYIYRCMSLDSPSILTHNTPLSPRHCSTDKILFPTLLQASRWTDNYVLRTCYLLFSRLHTKEAIVHRD